MAIQIKDRGKSEDVISVSSNDAIRIIQELSYAIEESNDRETAFSVDVERSIKTDFGQSVRLHVLKLSVKPHGWFDDEDPPIVEYNGINRRDVVSFLKDCDSSKLISSILKNSGLLDEDGWLKPEFRKSRKKEQLKRTDMLEL